MNPNLRERAKRVGDSAGHHAEFQSECHWALCPGCRAERAALVELEAAVAEERARFEDFLDSDCDGWLCEDYRAGALAAWRDRGQR